MKKNKITPLKSGGFLFQTPEGEWSTDDKIDLLASIFAYTDSEYSEVKQAYAKKIQQTLTSDPELYTVRDYMNLKNISRQRVYQLIAEGKLRKEKIEGYTFLSDRREQERGLGKGGNYFVCQKPYRRRLQKTDLYDDRR